MRPAEPEQRTGRSPWGQGSGTGSTALGVGVVAALLLIVAVASSVQGIPRFTPPDIAFGPIPVPEQTAEPTTIAPFPPSDLDSNDVAGRIVLIVLLVIAAAIVGFLVFMLVRAIVRAWRARLPQRAAAAPSDENFVLGAEPDPAAAAPAIRRGIADALRAIDDHAEVSDAIVAAWIGLEESAADAGMRRGTSETPAEFTLRIITGARGADRDASGTERDGRGAERDAPSTEPGARGIERDARALLRLYERVRFAGHAATQSDREEARRALAAIDEAWR